MHLPSTTDKRNAAGVKWSSDMYRKGGERICWIDGYIEPITKGVLKAIRDAGFCAWRTKDTVWVRNVDADAIAALKIDLNSFAPSSSRGAMA